MNMAYYPGCSLSGTAFDYDRSIKDLCTRLGVNLVEIPDWNCCGASSAHMTNHEVAMRLSMRNLLMVKEQKLDILIPCPACFGRLKSADKALRENPERWDVEDYDPDFNLVHISTFLARPEILEKYKGLVASPIQNMPVACYYGCLSLRPPAITDAPNHEMPTTLEDIVSAIGAKPLSWSYRTECCSGSLTMTRPDIAKKLVGDIVTAARRAGAAALVTDCPMCQANVESRQLDGESDEAHLPVYYATELIMATLCGDYPHKQKKLHLVPAEILNHYFGQQATLGEESP